MPEVVIKYKKPETLKILKLLAKYLDFEIVPKNEDNKINGVSFIPGDKTIDIQELSKIFTGKNLDAKQLRKDAWTRKKS